ncbi:MAG: hypothetical protein HY738_11405 [Bacteroidia bacterium]|nr:hypothetical protein [Bacteroidia bacterium]
MKQQIFIITLLTIVIKLNSVGQIKFDYTGAELVINYFTDTLNKNEQKIIKHPGYQHILLHSQKFSSQPLTEKNLLNSLKGKDDGFDFSGVKERSDTLKQIIQLLKNNEQEIRNEFVNLPLYFLPEDYKQIATIYFVIGGYDGIAFDEKICVNIDFKQFRDNFNEIKLYIAHELFHIGFEKYQELPDIFRIKTVKELKTIVLAMTMNEGLATLTPYHKRISTNELSDFDYKTLLDSSALSTKINQFNSVLKYLDENSDKEITNEILGNVLGQCSGDRLFYIVGCYMGLKIESKFGKDKISELVKETPELFFETYKQIE